MLRSSIDDDFDRAVEEFRGIERTAWLGCAFGSTYLLVDPKNSKYYYIRTPRTRAKAFNKANAPNIPDLEVIIKYDPDIGIYIDSVADTESNRRLIQSVGGTVARHSHARFSGNAFPIDARLFQQFSVYASQTNPLEMIVREGRYDFRGQTYWFPSKTVDLAPFVPTAPNQYRWAVVCLEPKTPTPMVVVKTTPTFTATPVADRSLITAVQPLEETLIPLTAVALRTGVTEVAEEDFEALYPLVTGWHYDLFADAIGRILTDATPNVLIDANGDVIISPW